MRRYLLCGTAALALTGGLAQAGGLTEPVMEPVVVEEQASSSGGILVPLLILAIVAIAIASSGSDDERRGGSSASDRRIKTDCRWVGMTADSLPVWRYRYVGTPQVFEGVMAQDVAMRRPDALVTWPNGLLAVNYSKLGLKMRQVA